MNKFPKLIIGVVTSEFKSYCDLPFFSQLMYFPYPNMEYIIVDNSVSPVYSEKLMSYGLKNVYWYRPDKPLREIMADCNELCRKFALNNKADFFLNLESDVFLTYPSILHYMVNLNLPVVTLPYFWGHNDEKYLLIRQALERSRDMEKLIVDCVERPLNFYEGFRFMDGNIKKIIFSAIGCMMIRRDVLEKIPFYIDLEKNKDGHADLTYATNLAANQIQTYLIAEPNLTFHWQSDWGIINALK